MNREQALFANDAFYLAFSQRDADAMAALWAEQATVSCVHPGWPALVGREEVLGSWQRILANPDAPTVECHQPEALLLPGQLAQVICYEQIEQQVLTASNWFLLEAGQARLIHHQASPCAHPPALEPARPRTIQ